MVARRSLPFALALLSAFAGTHAGCGGGGSSGGGGGGGTTPTGPGAFGLTTRVPVTTLTFPNGPPQPGTLGLEPAFSNLGFNSPVYLTHPGDGTDRIFVVEQGGRILVFDNDDAVTSFGVFLDITARVNSADSEQGLLGLAFDPNYSSNGFFYVNYTRANGAQRIARFSVTGNPNVADAASEGTVIEIGQPFTNHNGGMIEFGPDGFLYVGVGDGGSGGDPLNHGQNLGTLLGTVLRIIPTVPHTVPSTNPFLSTPGAAPEIYAYGLRNPWRFSFDRSTGALWLGDVGQVTREEIDIIGAGGNYGWRAREGATDFNNPGGLGPFVEPIIDYPRAEGTTVVGGYVYRGAAIPQLQGHYVYADYGTGTVWDMDFNGSTVISNQVITNRASISSFGEDRDGELYAVQHSTGDIFRFELTGGGGGGPFPQRLSDTGIFSNTANLVPAPGVLEYAVNAPFYSDTALKRRWIALPGNAQISFTATGAWNFPLGTALVKHFEVETAPGQFQRVETRVLLREQQSGAWAGYAYRWNAAQTDADLLTSSVDVPLTIQPSGSAPFSIQYHIPSRTECLQCHNPAAGDVLGIRTRQLHGDFAYAQTGVTDNQLRAWNNIDLFSSDIGDPVQYAAFAALNDTSVIIGARARTYLHVNCAPCHQPSAPAPGGLDFRFDTPLANANVLNVAPTEGNLGLTNPRRIEPGDRNQSVVYVRMQRTDTTRMPPPRDHPDMEGLDIIGSWIDGL